MYEIVSFFILSAVQANKAIGQLVGAPSRNLSVRVEATNLRVRVSDVFISAQQTSK